MSSLEVTGATLSYEKQGSGPVLLLIPGAQGSGVLYFRTAALLAASFTVVTYDRRGHSKSPLTGPQDYSQRLETDADDAAALIKHVSPGNPANVFGSSSGAIVTWSLVSRHPELVRRVILHEPPLLRTLPDAEKTMEETREVYEIYRAQGHIPAWNRFLQYNLSQAEGKNLAALGRPPPNPYDFGNIQYWFEREVTAYPFKHVDYDELAKLKGKIVFCNSIDGQHMPAGRVPAAMAAKLDMNVVTIIGGHLPYLTHPEEFKDALIAMLV